MRKVVVVAAGCVAVLAVPASEAVAFDRGCGGRAVECYRKVRTPDVYGTVHRQVVVRPGYQEVVTTPAAVLMRPARIEVQPGRWHAEHVPAVRGTMVTKQLVTPARTTYVAKSATFRTVHETVVVKPATMKWERRRGVLGREEMCKVEVPAVTKTVARTVMVEPARKVPMTTPAVYRDVVRAVEVQPARVRHVYQPPVHQWIEQPMVVRPATAHVVTHPPVTTTVSERVLVQPGTMAWEPVRGRHW